MHELEQADLVKSHYNTVSKTWGDFYDPTMTFANYNFLVRKRHVLDLVDKGGDRLLDAGCGTGDFIPDLLERGREVFGIDFAEEMIDQAKSRLGVDDADPRVHLAVGDVYKLQFDSNFFDGMIAVGLVEYLADLDAALREMYRVLKPGGYVIITIPNIASPFMAYETAVPKVKGVAKSALAAMGLRQPERAYFQRHVLPWAFDRQLKRIGFHKTNFAFCTYGFFSSRGLESFSLNLTRRMDGYKRSPLGILGTNYIVKVTKPQQQ